MAVMAILDTAVASCGLEYEVPFAPCPVFTLTKLPLAKTPTALVVAPSVS